MSTFKAEALCLVSNLLLLKYHLLLYEHLIYKINLASREVCSRPLKVLSDKETATESFVSVFAEVLDDSLS